jgi:thiol-disulfide isomerase/thioredoxin
MVIEAQDANFQTLLQENPKTIVKFYADWCGNCRLFKPKYKRIATEEPYKDIAFLDVDAQNNPETRHLAKVETLPYFAIFQNGTLLEGMATNKEELVKELLAKLA